MKKERKENNRMKSKGAKVIVILAVLCIGAMSVITYGSTISWYENAFALTKGGNTVNLGTRSYDGDNVSLQVRTDSIADNYNSNYNYVSCDVYEKSGVKYIKSSYTTKNLSQQDRWYYYNNLKKTNNKFYLSMSNSYSSAQVYYHKTASMASKSPLAYIRY